jgi:hypothetical protein
MERRRKFSLTASVIAPEASVTSVADCLVARAAVGRATVLRGDGRRGSGGRPLVLCGCFGSLARPGWLFGDPRVVVGSRACRLSPRSGPARSGAACENSGAVVVDEPVSIADRGGDQ